MSEIKLSTYINLQGRAREAMELYQRVLGGNLDTQTTSEQGVTRREGTGDSIAYFRLDTGGGLIIASDGHPDYPAKIGENMGISVGGTDKDRLSEIFSGLAEGGRVKMPLSAQPWGAEVGWLEDKFGITWMVSIDQA